MKISYNWLKDFIDLDEKPDKLGRILTNIGLEVEGIEIFEEIKGGMKGILIGEVLSCEPHPNADKLYLTKVNVGQKEPLSIVCGAPNVAAGQKVMVATIGTELFMGDKSLTIQKTKLRGEESEGMICAEDEVGLGTGHEGIMELDPAAVPGTPASEYFHIASDTVFEIGLTPNRIDAASHFGVARDLAAYYGQKGSVNLHKPFITEIVPDNSDLKVEVRIEDTEGCRRFSGVTISDVQIEPSPRWLQNRLRAIGLSPINNVVDITNYVMFELGQPLHAYDADKLAGRQIIVRRPEKGTPFITLDGEERKLTGDDVMVCDGQDGVCIAGVFGGLHSGVTETTKNIFLESAYFDPVKVRRTAKHHGLATDSSFRFERGVDPENTLVALKRAAGLIKELAKGKISSELVDVHPSPIKRWTIDMLYSHIDRLAGKSLKKKTIKSILTSLDIKVLSEQGDHLKVEVAPYRVDVTREADVIEEILRMYGYNNIDFSDKLRTSLSYQVQPDNEKMVNIASDFLTDNGFTEIMSNSLTKAEYYESLTSYPKRKLVPILNPLSADLNVMRQTLLFSGLEAIGRNINHKNPDLRLYEFGRIYSLKKQDLKDFNNFSEEPAFGLFLTGAMEEQSWAVPETPVNFFQLKTYYTNLLRKLGVDINSFVVKPLESMSDIFEGGLEYILGGESTLQAGRVDQNLLRDFDIEQEVFYAEIAWSRVLPLTSSQKSFSELPRFPEVRRDLALLLDESVQYAQIEELAFNTEKDLLRKVELFDFYKGKNIPQGKKSYAVTFILQDLKKTLTDKEIDRIMAKITQVMLQQLNAEVR